jgi:hypothetical protein
VVSEKSFVDYLKKDLESMRTETEKAAAEAAAERAAALKATTTPADGAAVAVEESVAEDFAGADAAADARAAVSPAALAAEASRDLEASSDAQIVSSEAKGQLCPNLDLFLFRHRLTRLLSWERTAAFDLESRGHPVTLAASIA